MSPPAAIVSMWRLVCFRLRSSLNLAVRRCSAAALRSEVDNKSVKPKRLALDTFTASHLLDGELFSRDNSALFNYGDDLKAFLRFGATKECLHPYLVCQMKKSGKSANQLSFAELTRSSLRLHHAFFF